MSSFVDLKLLLFLLVITTVSGERIKDMIYMSIDGVAACFRRHNGTHQFGCSSSRGGSVGVIQMVETLNDLSWLETNATAGPYTAIMSFSMFREDVMSRLQKTNNINGVLLVKHSNDTIPSSYSPEDTCPNRYSGSEMCTAEKPWNPWGNNFLLQDWPFPMFFMENDELFYKIRDCYTKHNAHDMDKQKERSLCALEMQSFMSSAVNSETCMRRNNAIWYMNPTRFCDALGDRNIHWPLSSLTDQTESMVLVTARLDAASLFDGYAPGANSAVTSFVTLIATAFYLQNLNPTVGSKNVLFSLLNGEAFDYIGSSRLVFDLESGKFDAIGGKTLHLDHIKTVIELGQLGNEKLYLHANNHEGNTLISGLQKTLDLEGTTLPKSVPPASIQRFLKARPNMTAVVLASHGDQFINHYYGGILDTAETLGLANGAIQKNLAKVAVKLGDLLYEHVTNKKSPGGNETFIEELISEMMHCYLENSTCDLFRAASPPGETLRHQTLPLYIGVPISGRIATSLAGQLMVLLTGQKLPNMTGHQCSEKYFTWLAGYNFTGICINSTVNYTIAISPAFIIEDYSFKSGLYSTWTESVWVNLSVRMFLKPSAAIERLTIILGSTVAILSFIVVWFINSKAEILFNHNRSIGDC